MAAKRKKSSKPKSEPRRSVQVALRVDLVHDVEAKAAEYGVSRSCLVNACVRHLLKHPRLRECVGTEKGGRRLERLKAKRERLDKEIRDLEGVA